MLEPHTLEARSSYRKQAQTSVSRVVPYAVGGAVQFALDEHQAGKLREPLTVPGKKPFRLGQSRGALMLQDDASHDPARLWDLASNGPVTSMRALPVEGGTVVVFRQDEAIWAGWMDGKQNAQGGLHKISGTGVRVGTPSVAWNGSEALVAFADLRDNSTPWTIRMAKAAFGHAFESSFEWQAPKGGPGGSAIAPSVLGLADGRWLVVWTEGQQGARDVRLQTYNAVMSPVGLPFTVSQAGANAGQGVATVSATSGAVIYLSIQGRRFELWGATIGCP